MTTLFYCPDYDTDIDNRRSLSVALLRLTARQERIVREHFGFNCPRMAMKDIAEEFCVSVSRVRQILYKAMRRLRMFLRLPRKRIEVDLAGANFGVAAVRPTAHWPPQELIEACRVPVFRTPQFVGAYSKLLPTIYQMAASGAGPTEINKRLTRDYHAAHWLDKGLGIDAYVPKICMISYILTRYPAPV